MAPHMHLSPLNMLLCVLLAYFFCWGFRGLWRMLCPVVHRGPGVRSKHPAAPTG